VGVQSPSKIKPPADCRGAQMYYVMQSMTRTSQQVRRGVLELSARDNYRMEREEKAGKGYVDFIFYPETPLATDGIILELKVDHSPEYAIEQIKNKNYAERFTVKTTKTRKKPQRILLVGIAYDKKKKKHSCKVEVLTQE
ncbi:MAG: PD-(D/E)XK nuclease domain-containing protein, partial [Eubacterium sp.]|nr:PD-(D/E)XK nuclease domain-containing protein [Eubacterium sp.]